MGVDAPSDIAFETARLQVRRLLTVDAPLENDLRALLTPNVLAPLPEPLQTVTSAKDWIEARLRESDVLVVSDTQSVLGLVLLARIERDVHLGYLLGEHAWGKGFATELIAGLLPELAKSGAKRVLAGVAQNNPASARVLIKCGFVLNKSASNGETDQYIWPETAL